MNRSEFSRLAKPVQDFFNSMGPNDLPKLGKMSPNDARNAYRQVGENLGGESVAIELVEDLHAKGPAGLIPIRIYRSKIEHSGDIPVIVYLHGGGWMWGDLDSHDKICRRLAHCSGCAVVAVDYRLAPEHPALAASDDVIAAIFWLYGCAKELGLNKQKIAIAGDSAGGNLAAIACQQLRDSHIQLKAQVLFYPATDLTPESDSFQSRQENGAIPPLPLEAIHFASQTYLSGFDAYDPRVSPLQNSNLQGLPPALFIVGDCDVLLDDSKHYARALKDAGNKADYVEVSGMIHGFIEMAGIFHAAIDAIEQASSFLKNHLQS
ncbi:MAG: Acetyl esterase [Candidatus Celerinatantimonas neptuna]|nr:MAG: Acetyl esterase [Candidatus Celerinatantimonas neptuna]